MTATELATAESRDPFRCPCGDPLLEPLRSFLEPTISAARAGELTAGDAAALASGELACSLLPALEDSAHAATLSRAIYQNHVSWAIWSKDWCDELARMLRSRGKQRVLEVAAGAGILGPLMRDRGIDWHTTDSLPAQIGLPAEAAPEPMDALSALTRYGGEVDAVFWSWWPARDEGDALLARHCADLRLPIVFVGEPKGGCTGSDALWEQWPVTPLSSSGDDAADGGGGGGEHGGELAVAMRLVADVPRWRGMRDRTWVVDASLLR